MSDDWQVVEEAHLHREHGGRLNFIQDCDTCNALARLREREAQLEEALREIAYKDGTVTAKRMLARRALAHEEEK